MRIETLSRYGLPGQIIKRWSLDGIRFLLPIQSESVSRFGLLDGRSLVISGPGTSGKTFCGELAISARVAARQKGVFIEPLKAVAEEKYRTFRDRYAPLGLDVKLATRDQVSGERDSNKFDIGIFIYEKFNSLTSNDISLIKSTSCFVLDEFQMISDPKRGIEFELAILKIRAFNPQAQIVIIMGSGSSPGNISSWLGLPLLEENRRPVDLRLGVLHRGTFHFREFNDLKEGDEHWLERIEPEEDRPISSQNMAAIKYLAGEREQILIFTSSRKSAVGLAEYLAANLDLGEAKDSLSAVADCAPSLQNEILERCLRHGVAFHHAELDQQQRTLVENGFRRGEIRILASTSTLASGVNLPAKNVFIESVKYSGPKTAHCRELVAPLTGTDFHQAAERAGRLGSEKSFGRAIMTADTQFEHEVLWDKYIYGRLEDPRSGLTADRLPDFVLRAISCGAASKPDNVESLLKSTYAGYQNTLGGDIHSKSDETLLYLEKCGLITIKTWGHIEPSKFGRAAGASGLSIESALEIRQRFLDSTPPAPLECLLLAARLSEWTSEASGYYFGNIPPDVFIRRIQDSLSANPELLTPDLFSALQDCLDRGLRQSLAAFLFAIEWCSGRPTKELEKFFQKGAGGLKRDSDTLCWLLHAIEKIARGIGLSALTDSGPVPGIGNLTDRLHFGVDERMLPLAREIGLDREFIRRLYDNGITAAENLYQTEPAILTSLLPNSAVCIIEEWRRAYSTRAPEPPSPIARKSTDARILFTGNTRKTLNEVIIDRLSVYLQPRLYVYLQKFWWGYIGCDPWVHKDTLDSGPNQAKYISRLRKILRDAGVTVEIISNGRGSYALKMSDRRDTPQ